MALFDVPGRLWAFGRKVEDLLAVQVKTERALEANQNHIIVEARSAASAAATTVAGAVLADVVTRITRIEMRTRTAAKRLSRLKEPRPRKQ